MVPKVSKQTLTFYQNSYLGNTTPTRTKDEKAYTPSKPREVFPGTNLEVFFEAYANLSPHNITISLQGQKIKKYSSIKRIFW